MLSSAALLCLYQADGKGSITFELAGDEDLCAPVGSIYRIRGHRYRVIRDARFVPCADGKWYWVIHAIQIAAVYH